MSSSLKPYLDEFHALLRYKLYMYYKLVTRYTPELLAHGASKYDSVEVLREKMHEYVKYRRPAVVPEDEFSIKYTPVVKEIHSIKEFKDYITSLNNILHGYDSRRIARGDDLPETLRKFELKIFDILEPHSMIPFMDTVLAVISELVDRLEFNDDLRTNFYRDLVNNANAKAGFLTVLEQTVVDFTSHKDPTAEKQMLDEVQHCGCTSTDGKEKTMYSRLSFALLVADNTISEHNLDTLKVYKCPKSLFYKEKTYIIYHLTKRH